MASLPHQGEALDAEQAYPNKGADVQPLTYMHHEESAKIIAGWSAQEWAAEEKKLLRKIDVQLIPWMTWVIAGGCV
jgi:hypothetical protein